MADAIQLRIGTDVQSVDEVRESIERFGMRYATRVFTAREIEVCGGVHAGAASRFAARFAAKEAVIKLLEPSEVVPTWRSIEIEQLASGAPRVQLTDGAETLAREAGIAAISISMSHGAGIGLATAVGVVEAAPPSSNAKDEGR